MAQHSKARTKAEAQFKQVQKPQPATQPTTAGGQATADYLAEGEYRTGKGPAAAKLTTPRPWGQGGLIIPKRDAVEQSSRAVALLWRKIGVSD